MKDMNKNFLPLNLQFFAEPEVDEPTQATEPDEAKDEPQLSAEERLQNAMTEMAKMKRAFDKASSEAASFKKQLRERQSADEIASQEKAEKEAEREEKFNKLMKENAINKLEKSFIALGYPEDKANKAAEAQYENDTDALFKIQSEHQAELLKAKEAELVKKFPNPQGGNGEDGSKVDPFLAGFNS